MRKIEALMIAAIRNGKDFRQANTEVEHWIVDEDTTGWTVRLHGHEICEQTNSGAMIISDCGWQTATTKSRLNALLGEFYRDDAGIYQQDFQWYLQLGKHTREMDKDTTQVCC